MLTENLGLSVGFEGHQIPNKIIRTLFKIKGRLNQLSWRRYGQVATCPYLLQLNWF